MLHYELLRALTRTIRYSDPEIRGGSEACDSDKKADRDHPLLELEAEGLLACVIGLLIWHQYFSFAEPRCSDRSLSPRDSSRLRFSRAIFKRTRGGNVERYLMRYHMAKSCRFCHSHAPVLLLHYESLRALRTIRYSDPEIRGGSGACDSDKNADRNRPLLELGAEGPLVCVIGLLIWQARRRMTKIIF